MEAIFNRSEIMKEAHRLHKGNKSMGWSFSKALKVSWSNAKARIEAMTVEARNEAIRQMWREQAEAKRQAERQAEHEKFIASGMDIHSYTMSNYYGNGSYNGD